MAAASLSARLYLPGQGACQPAERTTRPSRTPRAMSTRAVPPLPGITTRRPAPMSVCHDGRVSPSDRPKARAVSVNPASLSAPICVVRIGCWYSTVPYLRLATGPTARPRWSRQFRCGPARRLRRRHERTSRQRTLRLRRIAGRTQPASTWPSRDRGTRGRPPGVHRGPRRARNDCPLPSDPARRRPPSGRGS